MRWGHCDAFIGADSARMAINRMFVCSAMLSVLQIEDLAGWSHPSSVDMIKVLIRDPSAGEKAELIEKRLKEHRRPTEGKRSGRPKRWGWGVGLGGRNHDGGERS